LGADGTLKSAEIYKPDGSFAPAADRLSARRQHTCTTLGDGRVLVAGGLNEDGAAASAEIYDPSTGAWKATSTPGGGR
jgi:Galactose oxidase, central domain